MKLTVIIFLWIIHITALAGIVMGYEDFFFPKSPFIMLYLLTLLIFFFKIKSSNTILLFCSFFSIGMIVEWIGVHTGYLFGNYYYKDNLGSKIDGIPILIGINWALLTFCSHTIAQLFFNNTIAIIITGAILMVGLDFFLEQICDYSGYWVFESGAGWFNYLCWFIISAILHFISIRFKLKGDIQISSHLYSVQLFFAVFLWIIITI